MCSLYSIIIFIIVCVIPYNMSINLPDIDEYSVLDKTELMLAFMVNRHGDRTPLKMNIDLCPNKEKVMEVIEKYGFGQLTNDGKRRSYEMGKFIRQRYDAYLSPKYNKSEIYLRATEKTRAKMTILLAMASVYPPTFDNWSQAIQWTPVPYNTVPVLQDDMLASFNCPTYGQYLKKKIMTPIPEFTAKYLTLLNNISRIICKNITYTPAMLYPLYDDITSQKHLDIPFDFELLQLLPELEIAANEIIVDTFASCAKLQAGVFLQNFFDTVDRILSGKNEPKIHMCSAHDIDVFTFAVVTRITPYLEAPKFNSVYSLELRRVLATGQYIVVPVYLSEPGQEEIYLKVDGCQGFCDLETFRNLTSESALTFKQYRTLCNYSEDINFDTSNID